MASKTEEEGFAESMKEPILWRGTSHESQKAAARSSFFMRQLAQLNHDQPALTVGSLINRIKVDSLLTLIRELLDAEQPHQQLQQLRDTLEHYFELRPSGKHMAGRELGRLESTPSLKYRAVA